MEHARLRKPTLSQGEDTLPGERALLASAAKCLPPMPNHSFPEYAETVEVPRYRIVVEVALHDRFEPLAGLAHRIVHTLTELLLNLPQLRPHAFADRLAPHREPPYPILPADMRESQEVERLGLAFPSSFPVLFGIPPELNPTRFVRMEFLTKLRQPFPHAIQKTIGFSLILES